MWTKSHSIVTKEVTGEQLWKLFADVNNWNRWDDSIEYSSIEGRFEKGNYFILKPKGGPKVRIQLVETTPNRSFMDLTRFPLAKMYGNHAFEETAEGLRITSSISVKGPLTFLWVKLVARNIADNLAGDIEKQVETAGKL